MALTRKYPERVGPAAVATGGAAAVYQARERVAIQRFTIANTTGGALNFTLHVVPVGGSASAANQIIPALELRSNDTIVTAAPTILEQGERLFALASGSGVNLMFIVNDRDSDNL